MPENEIPPAMRVDIYSCFFQNTEDFSLCLKKLKFIFGVLKKMVYFFES
jgi:hypothetical protein